MDSNYTVVYSKMRSILRSKLSEEDFAILESKLAPWPKFKLFCSHRKPGTGIEKELVGIDELIETKNTFEDVSEAMNMYTRLKNINIQTVTDPTVVRQVLRCSFDDWKTQSDVFVDEYPLHVPLTEEQRKEREKYQDDYPFEIRQSQTGEIFYVLKTKKDGENKE